VAAHAVVLLCYWLVPSPACSRGPGPCDRRFASHYQTRVRHSQPHNIDSAAIGPQKIDLFLLAFLNLRRRIGIGRVAQLLCLEFCMQHESEVNPMVFGFVFIPLPLPLPKKQWKIPAAVALLRAGSTQAYPIFSIPYERHLVHPILSRCRAFKCRKSSAIIQIAV
jgi:hypothetical protein